MQNRKATYVEKTPNDVYRDVGEHSGLTADEVSAIGGLESQHGKYKRPLKGGSARGLFQFQPETAEYLQPGSSESLNDMNTQSELMKKYLEHHKAENLEDAYVKHNLGSGRGQKLLDAPDDTPITAIIPDFIIKANPSLYNVKTVGEAKERIKHKLHKGKESNPTRPNLLDLFKGK